MVRRTVTFVEGGWYHCYSRTIDRCRPFENQRFVERFLETLYLANNKTLMPVIPHLHKVFSHEEMFSIPREKPIVAIGCYCLMPTHYHLLLQPLVENGITQFMHKVGTGFTNFFNVQNERIGNLFVRPFRSKHIDTDQYLDRIIQYIHLNPIELFEPQWKRGIIHDQYSIPKRLRSYEYSSLWEHEGKERAQSSILDLDPLTLVHDNTDITKMIPEAAEYYQFLELDL